MADRRKTMYPTGRTSSGGDNFDKLVKSASAYSRQNAELDRMSILRQIRYGNKLKNNQAKYESRQYGINTGLQFAQLLTGVASNVQFNDEMLKFARKEGIDVTSGNIKNVFGTPEFSYNGNKYSLDDIAALKQYREMQDQLEKLDIFKNKKNYTQDEYNIDYGG